MKKHVLSLALTVALASGCTGDGDGDDGGNGPFWLALETLSGNVDGDFAWSGALECASLDSQLGPGVYDTNLAVQGTWTIAPE